MSILRQPDDDNSISTKGPRARTRRLILDTATRLMQEGITPSVSDVADAAEVSRATAYRYFPSQSALVEAVVDKALGPILSWDFPSDDVELRVENLFKDSLPLVSEFEATFRAALKLSLEQKAKEKDGLHLDDISFKRGHRVDLITKALLPLRNTLPPAKFDRLVQGLSLLFGIEALVVLGDINGLESTAAHETARWAAVSLVRAAIEEEKHNSNSP